MILLKLLRVSGHSLHPRYRDGDYVLVSQIPPLLDRLAPGDAIVFRDPVYGTLVKLVERVQADPPKVLVIGVQEGSLDSRRLGPIDRCRVLGKVIWHFRKI